VRKRHMRTHTHSPRKSHLERVPSVTTVLFWMLKHTKMGCRRSNSHKFRTPSS